MEAAINKESALNVLIRMINQAQKTGCFQLKEAALLHKNIVFLTRKGHKDDKTLTDEKAFAMLFQAANVGQSKGAFNLDDAALLDKVIDYLSENKED